MGDVATPLELVVIVAELAPLKEAVAPVPGATNVTETPATGLLLEFRTVACKAANVVFNGAVCGVPAVALMVKAELLTVFVRLNVPDVAPPMTLATTA
jgi:hypothetical protein